ncbi:hypothetical protein [Pedobacter miscanthi]|nr:hypothetical protein [Pedobacter miscanthi]
MDSIYGLFLRYLILTIIYLVLLTGFGEYYFFTSLNVEILNFDDISDLISSQRGLNHWETSVFLIFLPFFITLGFIMHLWIFDTTTLKRARNLAFLIGILPFSFLPALISSEQTGTSLLLIGVSLILLLVLWIILFHIRMFQFSYLSIHLFISCCILTTFMVVNRIDNCIQNCLNSTMNLGAVQNSCAEKANSPVVFIGSTSSFNIYYSPTEQRSIIIYKTARKVNQAIETTN